MTRLRSVMFVLSGQRTVSLHQEFLIRNNHTDLQILKNTKVHKLLSKHLLSLSLRKLDVTLLHIMLH